MEVANICLISRHYIDSSAFHGCTGLKEVVLSNKLTTLPEGIFEDCNNLETVVLPEKLVSIPENAFRNTKLTELNLPESVTEIGQYAFMGCNNLKQINLTDNITKLGDHVFASCANLSDVICCEL